VDKDVREIEGLVGKRATHQSALTVGERVKQVAVWPQTLRMECHCCVAFLRVLVDGSDGRIKGQTSRKRAASKRKGLTDIRVKIGLQDGNGQTGSGRSFYVATLGMFGRHPSNSDGCLGRVV
jgi:hypothetical protein